MMCRKVGFDCVISIRLDNAVDDDRKSHKTINANYASFESTLDLSAFAALETEAVA